MRNELSESDTHIQRRGSDEFEYYEGYPGLLLFKKKLNSKFCNSLINYFDNENSFKDSHVINNVHFSELSFYNEWNVNIRYMIDELDNNLQSVLCEYYDCFIDESHYMAHEIKERNYDVFNRCDKFSIRKYNKDSIKDQFRHDFTGHPDTLYRQLSVIFYLNDVPDGGGEQFFVSHGEERVTIKPKIGDVLVFPSNFPFHHRSSLPISNNKYVVTTWITNFYQRWKQTNEDITS